jgi:hypothetical protein
MHVEILQKLNFRSCSHSIGFLSQYVATLHRVKQYMHWHCQILRLFTAKSI